MSAHTDKYFLLRIAIGALMLCWSGLTSHADPVPAGALFQQGTNAYAKGDFDQAALCFRGVAKAEASPGAWHNLGNAEWQAGRPGPAILAWERGHWLGPFNTNTQENLRFARKARQLDPPELTWYETCSTWLPASAWPWIAALTFWGALALLILPGIFRWHKAGWQQGLAAAGFTLFLLTLPAIAGVRTRSKLGVLLPESTSLRLTPTHDAQVVSKIPPGETARIERRHGEYIYVRSGGIAGWVHQSEFALIAATN